MKLRETDRLAPAIAMTLGLAAALAGCGSKKEPAAAEAAPPAPAVQAEQAAQTAAPTTTPVAVDTSAPAAPTSWTPEALEELLAPIALYPDPVLSQVLIASTNPQEVLDAGNWLLQNQTLTGTALDEAASKVGFTPPVRALIQFPETVDMLCMELDWTTELGQAFAADQAGVLDAVQRLRKQAQDVGNLKSSDQMKVETQQQDGKDVVLLSPPSPQVVYVPQYDPVAVYAPAPAAAAAAPATTTTTTTTGHSTGALITTGLLAFGAGMLINEIFNDDDDYYRHNGYYYPNYGHGGMPYYPPYPYRPSYGGGYYPSNGYHRPPNYQHGYNNNNVVVINNGGKNDYWNDRNKRTSGYQKPGAYQPKSPITQAKPNRPELQQLNQRKPSPMPKDVKRPSSTASADSWRNQSGYAGAKGSKDKTAAARPAMAGNAAAAAKGSRDLPKAQGSYAGSTPDRVKPQQPANRPATRDLPQKPSVQKPAGGGDRGYDVPARQPSANRPSPAATREPMNKPSPAAKPQPMNRPTPSSGRDSGGGRNKSTAVSSGDRGGSAERAASQRGQQSLPQGARSKGGGGKQKQGR